MNTDLHERYMPSKDEFSLLDYLEELHKLNYWCKPELSIIMRNAERRSIKLVEKHMRRICK